jgi:type I restriction enzyme S subunit
MYKSDMAPYINLRDIRSLSMPVFDPSVQHRQSKLQSGLLDRFDACCVENESLARTRDELLPLLMSGKLSVKAAETVASEVL